MTPEEMGQRLRELRENAGMSVTMLAVLSGVDRATIWRIERGIGQGKKRRGPDSGTLLKLAEALRMDVRDLLVPAQVKEVTG